MIPHRPDHRWNQRDTNLQPAFNQPDSTGLPYGDRADRMGAFGYGSSWADQGTTAAAMTDLRENQRPGSDGNNPAKLAQLTTGTTAVTALLINLWHQHGNLCCLQLIATQKQIDVGFFNITICQLHRFSKHGSQIQGNRGLAGTTFAGSNRYSV
jgi:hypothetical protein